MPAPHTLLSDAPYDNYRAYRAATGACAVTTARSMDPAEVLAEVRRSGLRGRGGAGFPTGTKWATLRNHPCETRYVICNLAEGEPGTFKDRWLVRWNPYAILEGLLIAAHVIGAEEIFLALKASFTREIDRLKAALVEMNAEGLFSGVRWNMVEGPEEYLFGEEKALLNVIEGEGPLPREAHQAPYEIGLFATPGSPNPALVNNAETFAHVSTIVRHGGASFAATGTPDTPGTLLFTLSGDIARPGVYEREAGISLRELFYDVGGGPPEGRKIKAVLSGVSSGVITPDRFEVPADFGSLAMIGSGLGSAGFMVFDDTRSIPRVAQTMMRFLYVESCNQCTACKHGLRTASTALDELFGEEGPTPETLERALHGAQRAPQANRCYLPVQGATLLPSLMNRFSHEFESNLAPGRQDSAPVPIPKLVDLDEGRGVFLLDERQADKQPDWTYAATAAPAPGNKPSTPAPASKGPVSVRLAPDVRDALSSVADAGGQDLDETVNRALRAWLASRSS